MEDHAGIPSSHPIGLMQAQAAASEVYQRALRRMKLPENMRPATTPYNPENPY